MSNIQAPRLARRANPNVEGSLETKDEPYAWEAREFMRKRLIGKEVCFTVEYKTPGTGREYGAIYLGKGLQKHVHYSYDLHPNFLVSILFHIQISVLS